MKMVIHGWLVFLALIAAVNTAVAGNDDDLDSAAKGDRLIGTQNQPHSDSSMVEIRVTSTQSVQRVKVPVALVDRIAVKAIRVGHHQGRPIHLNRIQISEAQVKIIGHRLVSDWSPGQLQPAFWLEEVHVTFPRLYIAGSWDVQALQRELERLGIKIKPKPATPKPTVQQLSG